jgi:hypothetical protein
MIRDRSVGTAMDYGLNSRGSIPGRDIFFSTEFRPGLGPILPPIEWVSEAFAPSGVGVKLSTHVHLVPSSELYLHSPICLHKGDTFSFMNV